MTSKDTILALTKSAKVEANEFDTVLRQFLKTADNIVMSISKGTKDSKKSHSPYLSINSSIVQSGNLYIPSVEGVSFLEQVDYLFSLVDKTKVQVSDRLRVRIDNA